MEDQVKKQDEIPDTPARPPARPLGNKEVEYSELGTFLRYLLDYRLKIFSFAVVFNGALMTLIHTYVKTTDFVGEMCLSALGLVTSVVFLMVERRIVFVYGQHIGYIQELEVDLGFGAVSKVLPKLKKGAVTIRACFVFLHVSLFIFWLAQLIYFIKK
jgi:hypothetical protein